MQQNLDATRSAGNPLQDEIIAFNAIEVEAAVIGKPGQYLSLIRQRESELNQRLAVMKQLNSDSAIRSTAALAARAPARYSRDAEIATLRDRGHPTLLDRIVHSAKKAVGIDSTLPDRNTYALMQRKLRHNQYDSEGRKGIDPKDIYGFKPGPMIAIELEEMMGYREDAARIMDKLSITNGQKLRDNNLTILDGYINRLDSQHQAATGKSILETRYPDYLAEQKPTISASGTVIPPKRVPVVLMDRVDAPAKAPAARPAVDAVPLNLAPQPRAAIKPAAAPPAHINLDTLPILKDKTPVFMDTAFMPLKAAPETPAANVVIPKQEKATAPAKTVLAPAEKPAVALRLPQTPLVSSDAKATNAGGIDNAYWTRHDKIERARLQDVLAKTANNTKGRHEALLALHDKLEADRLDLLANGKMKVYGITREHKQHTMTIMDKDRRTALHEHMGLYSDLVKLHLDHLETANPALKQKTVRNESAARALARMDAAAKQKEKIAEGASANNTDWGNLTGKRSGLGGAFRSVSMPRFIDSLGNIFTNVSNSVGTRLGRLRNRKAENDSDMTTVTSSKLDLAA